MYGVWPRRRSGCSSESSRLLVAAPDFDFANDVSAAASACASSELHVCFPLLVLCWDISCLGPLHAINRGPPLGHRGPPLIGHVRHKDCFGQLRSFSSSSFTISLELAAATAAAASFPIITKLHAHEPNRDSQRTHKNVARRVSARDPM